MSEQVQIVDTEPKENGDEVAEAIPKGALCMTVWWDPQTQDTNIAFDNRVYRSWPFVISRLQEAKEVAERVWNELKEQAAMQQQLTMQREMQRAAQIAEAVRANHEIGKPKRGLT